jgi:vitamin B12 transporter
MKTSRFARHGLAAACAVCCAASFAQTTSTSISAPELQPIVVTASRNPQLLTDALPHTTVLSAADISRSQAQDLPALLQREAGVQITQSGGRGTASSLFMRGSASVQVLVLLDGVPLTKQDASGAVSVEHLALEQIERIEIVRGNVSAIYGTGAIGGVVQLFSKQGAGKPSAQITTEAGSRGSHKVQLGAQGSFGEGGATKLSAGLGYQRTQGFSAINTVQVPAANLDDDGYTNRNFSLSLAHTLAQGHSLGMRVSQATGRYEFDSSFGAPTDLQDGRTRVQTVTAYADNRITADWLSKLSISQSKDDAFSQDNGAFGYRAHYDSRNRILNWTNTVALNSAVSLTAGVEQQKQGIDADDGSPYSQRRSVRALFAGLQGQWGAHQLQLNLRNDKTQGLAAQTTGYLGYGYAITPQWKILASSSTAFNIAPLGYLYAPFFGNPALQPEKARSQEMGLQWSAGKQVLRATVFSTRSRNLFEYDFSTNAFANVVRTKNSGLEVSYSGQIGAADVRASLTSQNPQDEMTGKVLNRRARTLGALSWNQPLGAWRLGADLRFSGARRDGAKRLGGYEVLDLSARYAFSKDLSAYGRIENLLDRRYQTVYSYNQAGRGVFVGLSWQPQF